MTEAEFQAQVVQLAGYTGWSAMHVRRSVGRRSGGPAWQTTTSIPGWPDLVLWHPRTGTGPLYRELKSDTGRVTPAQQAVLDSLAACGADTAVWRPKDWPTIEHTLTNPGPRPPATWDARALAADPDTGWALKGDDPPIVAATRGCASGTAPEGTVRVGDHITLHNLNHRPGSPAQPLTVTETSTIFGETRWTAEHCYAEYY